MMQGERVVQITDSTDTEGYRASKAIRELIDRSGVRTTLGVALRNDSAVLGAIFVNRREVRPFIDKQIALLQNFAAQAVIAMENARLLTETREALEQQTATAEVLQVINSSPGELAPVFDAILEKALTLSGAAHGALTTYDGEHFRAVALHTIPEPFGSLMRQPFRPPAGGAHGRLLQGERLIHIMDVAASEPINPMQRAAIDAGVRTLLMVPLRKDYALLGYITAHRREVRPFNEKQITLLENFAAQAVIAMDNARLLTETREALEQQTATAEVLGVINSSPGNLVPVFDAVLERAIHLCEDAFGAFFIREGERLRAVSTRGLSERLNDFVRCGFEVDWSGPLWHGTTIEHIADLTKEDLTKRPGPRAAMELGGARTLLNFVLRKDDVLFGVFSIIRQEVRPFTDKQIALLENFAAQAVIAMENARLINETREALEQQTATTEILQVINSSPGDLAPVFDAVVEKAMRLCEATNGTLFTYDGDRFHAAAIHGDTRFVEWCRQLGPFRLPANTGLGRVSRGERLVHIADVRELDAFGTAPEFRQSIEIAGTRSQLTVALCRDEVLLGALGVYRQEIRPFTDKQITLLQNFAAQAVIAMENARLIGELHERTDQIAELNRGLEARVAEQVEELGRVGRLKRFLAPQLAELIVSRGDEKILESHRRDIVVVFCDLRGYTAFTETAEPEEVLDFLREYHGALGPLVSQFEGTLDQFSGDGIMVFFNDPVPIPDPAARAVNMAVAMRDAAGTLIASWRRRGRLLGFGAGIAQGYATLGQIGFAERSGYTAIGTVCNLAARLCAEAQDGQILIGQRVAVAVEETITLEEVGALTLKGLTQPVVAYNVPLAPIQPALRVIEGGPQSV
jgi:GAF domain-containing protein